MQVKINQSIFSHPSEVMLVDDDVNLLNGLIKNIDPNFSSTAFTNPEKALEHLKKNVLPLKKLSQAIISDIEPSEEKHLSTENVAINFTPLHAQIDKPTRFTKILVVVVDRAMKEMDGLDFCRAVRQLGLPVKLILLTGHTKAKEALIAFNDHIIDAFVEKLTNVDTTINHVNSHIKTLAFQAFCESSEQLLGPILNKLSLLRNEEFANFSKKLFIENKVAEYYLLNSSCSYLLITITGTMKVLLIKSPEDFINAYDIAFGNSSLDAETLEALKSQKVFPFTGMDSYFCSDPTKWKGKMVPMTKVDGLDLHYALINYPQEKAFSFDQYINETWEPKID